MQNSDDFINELANNFPLIRNEILDDDYAGLPTLQISCFTRFTQKAIDNNDLITVKKCFEFVETSFGNVELRIENALFLSYLGKLNFHTNSKAKKLLSSIFKNALTDIESYNSLNSKNDSVIKFLKDL